jgi:hypothetical protein
VWKPQSKLDYLPLNPAGHLIVVACPMLKRNDELRERWAERAVAIIGDSSRFLRDIVRDILANPQVRAVVCDGEICGREAYDKFWLGNDDPGWRIDMEHLNLVRQFVDLYDDDCMWRVTPQPFWPARIVYLEDMETK